MLYPKIERKNEQDLVAYESSHGIDANYCQPTESNYGSTDYESISYRNQTKCPQKCTPMKNSGNITKYNL